MPKPARVAPPVAGNFVKKPKRVKVPVAVEAPVPPVKRVRVRKPKAKPQLALKAPPQPVLPKDPGPVLIALKHLAETKKKSTGYGSFHYGDIRDGEAHENGNVYCHAGLYSVYQGAVWTQNPIPPAAKLDPAIHRDYVHWLNHDSPWASIPMVQPDEFAYEHGWVIDDLKKPRNLVANFCIATRVPSEHSDHIERWHKMMKAGVDSNLAFVLGSGITEDGKWNTGQSGWHHPLSTAYMTKSGAESFVLKHPIKLIGPMEKQGNYHPCDAMWEPGEDEAYSTFLFDTYKAQEAVAKRAFAVGNAGAKAFSMDRWIEVGLAESKRIKENANDGNHKAPEAHGVGEQ